ncbi:MAG: hypothetical protein JW778_00690 [Candidatus Altiarchaeota archaeon]|nr:hypothetical protein [Candidatus Altiarchaeota archaeon]
MEKKIIVVAGILSFIFLAMVGFMGFLITDNTPTGFMLSGKTAEPEEYVQRITREGDESLFFDKIIDRIPARVSVVHPRTENNTIKVGVSADTNELNFGVVIQNMSVRKFLNIASDDASTVKICIVSYGNISSFIRAEQVDFIMEKGDSTEVMLEFNGDLVGNYTGEVDVVTKKPKYGFLESLLPFVAC